MTGTHLYCAILLAGCGRLGFAELDTVEIERTTTSTSTLAIGMSHACVREASGDVHCWGANLYGQLGTGSPDVRIERPVLVGGGWDALSAGKYHTCGLRQSELWCWGDNSEGQLGLGFRDATPHTTPERIGTDSWLEVDAGRYHTCAIRADETLWCWGYNDEGNLGVGDRNPRGEPTQVGVDAGWHDLRVGGGYGGFARRADGSSWAWGYNSRGELGVGDVVIHDRPIETGRTWSDVGAGIFVTCGLDEALQLSCWGRNDHGELGLGDLVDRYAPVQVADHAWIRVSPMQAFFTCGIDVDRALYCWGANSGGGLGVGDTVDRSVPTHVVSLDDGWSDVRGGGGGDQAFACGLHDSGLYCWGGNGEGQLGVGDRVPSTTPRRIEL